MRRFLTFVLTIFLLSILLPSSVDAQGAVLSLYPKSGTFYVGSTFDVSVMLDTKGQTINTIQVGLNFPADKLQVVEPLSGKSIIKVWTSAPEYSNSEGKIFLQGGIPNPGIKTSSGQVFTVTFRSKSPGRARIVFEENSKVLLNDGQGTDILSSTIGGSYNIVIPPPEGPAVYSPTHPDQTEWYNNNSPTLAWQAERGVSDYSYILTRDPATIPNNVSEGSANSTYYEDLENGLWYFHIKAKKSGNWGGVSTFLLRIDTEPPADFEIQCDDKKTSNPRPVISFFTTDSESGVSHYEVKIIDVSRTENKAESRPFSEEVSPYQLPSLDEGIYDVIVRAYDGAGNWRDEKIRIEITSAWISFVREKGLFVKGILIPWPFLFLILIVILGIFGFLIYRNKKKDKEIKQKVRNGVDNMKDIIDNEILILAKKLRDGEMDREKIREQIEVLEKLRRKSQEGEEPQTQT